MRWRGQRFVALLVLATTIGASAQVEGVKVPALRCGLVYRVVKEAVKRAFSRAPVESLKNTKISHWNLNELKIEGAEEFELASDWKGVDRTKIPPKKFKSEDDLQKLKNSILRESPDVMLVTEVVNLASMRMFAVHERYLNGAYEMYFHPVNHGASSIGFLVKKGLPLNVQFETHIHLHHFDSNGRWRRRFTRDVPTLLLRKLGDKTSDNVVVLIGLHAKSQRFSPGREGDSSDVREVEFGGLDQIKDYYRKLFPRAKIGVLGDINVDVQNSPEIDILKKDSESFLDLVGIPRGDPARNTQFHFGLGRDGRSFRNNSSQTDDFLIDDGLFAYLISGRVVPFADIYGNPKPDPRDMIERYENATDHKMIEAIFDFFSLFYGSPH